MVRFRGYEDEPELRTADWSQLRRLWPYVRPYRRGFGAALLILVLSFGIEIVGPYLVRLALDGPVADVVAGRPADTTGVLWLGGLYLAATGCAVALGYAYTLLTTANGQRVIRDVRLGLFDHLLRLSPRFFDRNPAGLLVTRTTSDVENLGELISTGVLQTLFDVLKIAGVLAVLLLIDVRLALITLATTPVVIAISLLFRDKVRKSYRRVRASLGRQNAFTAEAIGGVRVARIFGQEHAVERRYGELNQQTRVAWLGTVFHFALFVALVDISLRTTQVVILYVGGSAIMTGTLTAGAFVQFWLYFTKLLEPIRELGERYNVLQSALSSSERIFDILDHEPSPTSPARPLPMPGGPARIEFDGVAFHYQADVPVLRGIDAVFEPGQTVAIVGPTGAGKTTVLSLVSRLYDPTAGTVRLDGTPLPQLDLLALRRRIAVVPQDVFLFTGSVLDNIRLFDEQIGEDRVWAALETIGAREFVASLEGQLQHPVQERGATFSHGQRQLLSFARALVTDPDVLVLDEATASIDSASEAMIHAGLERLLRDRTALIVAHRLSTVRDADQILVMRGGKIAEHGVHDELLAADGLYSAMVRSAAGLTPERN